LRTCAYVLGALQDGVDVKRWEGALVEEEHIEGLHLETS